MMERRKEYKLRKIFKTSEDVIAKYSNTTNCSTAGNHYDKITVPIIENVSLSYNP
jgi:hypothetical protein